MERNKLLIYGLLVITTLIALFYYLKRYTSARSGTQNSKSNWADEELWGALFTYVMQDLAVITLTQALPFIRAALTGCYCVGSLG